MGTTTLTAAASFTNSTTTSASLLTESSAPSIRPSLLLDFANAKSLDPRITFTRASTATRVNEKGLIENVASGAARFDHDMVTGECKGLLIEEQRTNLLTYSEQFDNAAWSKVNATVTANAVTAPDGTLSADKLVEDTATGTHYTGQNQSLSLSTTYTGTYYVKAGERTLCRISTGGDLWSAAAVYIDLSNGTATTYTGTASASTVSITNCGNGWYKCSLTATTGASGAGSRNFLIIPVLSGTTYTYTGDGTSGIYIWGAQLEAGSFATSYIPTTAAAATRIADSAVITGTNFSSWYRQDEGTVFTKFDVSTISANSGVFSISDNTNANYIAQLSGSYVPVFGIMDTSVSQAYISSVPYTPETLNASQYFSATYKKDDFARSSGGLTAASDTLGTIPTVSQLSLGRYGIGYPLNGHISKLAYYPKRLSNTELQVLSQG